MTKAFFSDVVRLGDLLHQARELADRISRHDYTADDDITAAEMLRTVQLCEMSDDRSMGDMLHWLEYTQRPRTEHRLTYNSGTGRYSAGDRQLGCGYTLELYVDDPEDFDHGWNFGRVEHADRHGGYYFYNQSGDKNYPLKPGMRVAVR